MGKAKPDAAKLCVNIGMDLPVASALCLWLCSAVALCATVLTLAQTLHHITAALVHRFRFLRTFSKQIANGNIFEISLLSEAWFSLLVIKR